MSDYIVLKVIVRFLLPFILLYAIYIQIHGEISPGGGFQAGIIFAAGFIVYSFIYDIQTLKNLIPPMAIRVLSVIGILVFSGIGVLSMLMGGNFLDYSVLMADKIQAQEVAIMLVEFGIGITVFSFVILIFYSFGEQNNNDA